MFKFSSLALASILAVSTASASSNQEALLTGQIKTLADPRNGTRKVLDRLGLSAPDSMTSDRDLAVTAGNPGKSTLRRNQECEAVALTAFQPSDKAQEELAAWGQELIDDALDGNLPETMDYKASMPTFVKEMQKACTDAGGDNYLFSLTGDGCAGLIDDDAFNEGGAFSETDLKHVPTCLDNCPSGEEYEELLTQLDPSCADSVTIESGASSMASGNVFLGIGAVVAGFTMLWM